ncbi:hypothetical protein FS837_000599 [Tulasnella sp. UAMH 9824]|nr:hypothetical protein FS837_000599 [Tulasnella sp. UAMH 9824]
MLIPIPRQVQITLILLNFLFLAPFAKCGPGPSPRSPSSKPQSANAQDTFNVQPSLLPLPLPADPSSPLLRRHVAITTSFARSEVYGPLAWIADTIMTKYAADQLPTSLQIYSSEPRFHLLLKRIGVLPADRMRPGDRIGSLPSPDIIRPRDQLMRDIQSTTLFDEDMGAMIDLVILGACEVDLERFGPDLLKGWDERPQDKKFMLVCGAHNHQVTDWFKYISEWSLRGSLRIVPISNQIVDHFHSSKDLVQPPSLYEGINVGKFYSVSEFVDFPPRPKVFLADVPCSAVLQGNYQHESRDLKRILHDLTRLLREDSQAWGYRWSDQERKYVVDHTTPYPPFVLHLIGDDQINVPSELQAVVVRSMVSSIDIAVPVFGDTETRARQASSIVHQAVMNHVPLLTTQTALECCPHLTSESMILRPSGVSEMDAIGLFRGARVSAEVAEPPTGKSHPPHPSNESSQGLDASPELVEDVKRMLSQGWKRSDESFARFKREIWEQNERVVDRLLKDS